MDSHTWSAGEKCQECFAIWKAGSSCLRLVKQPFHASVDPTLRRRGDFPDAYRSKKEKEKEKERHRRLRSHFLYAPLSLILDTSAHLKDDGAGAWNIKKINHGTSRLTIWSCVTGRSLILRWIFRAKMGKKNQARKGEEGGAVAVSCFSIKKMQDVNLSRFSSFLLHTVHQRVILMYFLLVHNI